MEQFTLQELQHLITWLNGFGDVSEMHSNLRRKLETMIEEKRTEMDLAMGIVGREHE